MFDHDTKVALESTVALVNTETANTEAGNEDALTTLEELDAFVIAEQWTGQRTRDEAELADVRSIRPRLRQFWETTEEEAVDIANDILVRRTAVPQLVRHDGFDWHVHATRDDAPLADRMIVEAAMAMIHVIRLGNFDRLRTCAAPDCNDVLVDLSRNGSKRFCSTRCSNRVAAAAYRAKRLSAPRSIRRTVPS